LVSERGLMGILQCSFTQLRNQWQSGNQAIASNQSLNLVKLEFEFSNSMLHLQEKRENTWYVR